MPDREKVIERLSDLKERLKWQKDIQGYGFYIDFIDDAIALLKEYEPIAPTKIIDKEYHIVHHSCGNCHKVISSHPRASYCQWCGKAVDWNA